MNFPRFRTIAKWVGAVLVLLWYLWMHARLEEFKALILVAPDLRDTPANTSAGTFLPELVAGVPSLEGILASEATFDPFGKERREDPLPALAARFDALPSLGSESGDIARAVLARLSRPTPRPAWPPDPVFDVPFVDTRTCLATGRKWVALARHLAARDQGKKALILLAGTALLGHELEVSEKSRVSLRTRSAGVSLRSMAGTGMMLAAPVASITFQDVQGVIRLLLAMEQNSVTVSDTLETEKRLVPGILKNASSDRIKSLLKSKGKEVPTNIVDRMLEDAALQSRVNGEFDLLVRESRRPYSKGVQALAAASERLDRYFDGFADFSPRNLHLFWAPTAAFAEYIYNIMLPNALKHRTREVEMQAKLRGGLLCLAVYSFHRERGKWPTALRELTVPFGPEFGTDPFSDREFIFGAGSPPSLRSAGPDGKPGTADDLEFMPSPGPVGD